MPQSTEEFPVLSVPARWVPRCLGVLPQFSFIYITSPRQLGFLNGGTLGHFQRKWSPWLQTVQLPAGPTPSSPGWSPLSYSMGRLCLHAVAYFIRKVCLAPSHPTQLFQRGASFKLSRAWCVQGTGQAKKKPPALGPPELSIPSPSRTQLLRPCCPVTLLVVYPDPHLDFTGPMCGGPTT